MTDSILDTMKNMLGIPLDEEVFDTELLVHINSLIFSLQQVGVGPTPLFVVESSGESWDEYLSDMEELPAVKSYIYLKLRQVFDPPATSYIIESFNRQIQEYEWRLNIYGDFEED